MVRKDGHITDESMLYLCFKVEGGRQVILLLHVDDLFLTRKEELIKVLRRILSIVFEMKELDMMHYFLVMEVWQNVDGIFLGQGKYDVGYLEEVWDDGLQGHDHTYAIKPEAIE